MSNLNNQQGPDAVHYDPVTDSAQYDRPPPPYSASIPTVTAVTQPPIVQTTFIVHHPLVKHNPTVCTCPSCHKRIITRVIHVNTRKTHIAAGFIFGFTFWCCLCCFAALPYIIPTFKTAEHYCPNCNAFIGSYSA